MVDQPAYAPDLGAVREAGYVWGEREENLVEKEVQEEELLLAGRY